MHTSATCSLNKAANYNLSSPSSTLSGLSNASILQINLKLGWLVYSLVPSWYLHCFCTVQQVAFHSLAICTSTTQLLSDIQQVLLHMQ